MTLSMVSKRKESSTQWRAFVMPNGVSDTMVVRWIPAIPGASSTVLKKSDAPAQTDAEEVRPFRKHTTSERETTPDAIYEEASDTKETQALSDPRSRDTRQKLVPFDYLDIKCRRDQGQTWPQINSGYGREVRHTFHRMKRRSNPTHIQTRGPQRKWVSSDYLDIERRRDRGQTWTQIDRAYGRETRTSFYRWKQQSNPIHTQTRGPRRCAKELLEIEQRKDRGDSWAEIKAVHGGTAEKADRFWKYSGRPNPGQQQSEAHTTPEQFAAIHDLKTNTRTTWPETGEQFGIGVNTIRLRYQRWIWSQDNDQREPHDAIVNSSVAESLAGSECRVTTAGSLTRIEKEDNLASSCYTRDTTSFDNDESDDSDGSGDSNDSDDSSTIVVQPVTVRSKDDASLLLCHFES
jgi:hypothetical protein